MSTTTVYNQCPTKPCCGDDDATTKGKHTLAHHHVRACVGTHANALYFDDDGMDGSRFVYIASILWVVNHQLR